MSVERALEHAIAEISCSLSQIIPARIDRLPTKPESPIETDFLVGLMALSYTCPCYDFGDTFNKLYASDAVLPVIEVKLQAPIDQYRADFLLTMKHKGAVIGKLVVECDGHHFHERTKEQASRDRSRDRAMTLAGYKVMRFTGSEIYRDLMQCVMDAHNAAWHFYQAPNG